MDYLSDQYDMFTEAASKTLSSQRASKSPSLPSLNAAVTAGKYHILQADLLSPLMIAVRHCFCLPVFVIGEINRKQR